MRRARFLGVLVLVLAMMAAPASAVAVSAPGGPLDLTGELGAVPYEIRVPADWNGTLVIYAHGYRDAADHPGETDNRSPGPVFSEAAEQAMLAAGYATAASAYASNGWAVAEGIHDTKALANRFTAAVGAPRTTLLVGVSMGSVIALESVEHFGGVYDGVMPTCAVAAGAPRTFDGVMAVTSAYAAVFGWPAAWGSPSDVRDDLDFESEVVPVLLGQLTTPAGAAKLEFVRLAAGVTSGPEWPFGIWYFATEGLAELERRAGGPVTQNLDHTYALSAADRAYLAGLGITGDQVDGYLAAMQASRTGAPPQSRHYLEQYADYTGKIKHPVLALTTIVDALVPPAHINRYQATVAAAGRLDNFATAWTIGAGHCAFTRSRSSFRCGHWSCGCRPGSAPVRSHGVRASSTSRRRPGPIRRPSPMEHLDAAGSYTDPADGRSNHWVEHLRVPALSLSIYSVAAGGADPRPRLGNAPLACSDHMNGGFV